MGRSGLYYEPVGKSAEELVLMRRIDEIHLEWPFYGSRKVSIALRAEGRPANRKCVQRLMRIESMAPKPNTNRPAPEHPVYRSLGGSSAYEPAEFTSATFPHSSPAELMPFPQPGS